MTTEVEIPIQERIFQLLQHLSVGQAHFAAYFPGDWQGLVGTHPEVISSLTLIGPRGMDLNGVRAFASRLLFITGDQGSRAEAVRTAVASLPDATLVTLRDYFSPLWADVIADRTEDIGSAMMKFLAQMGQPQVGKALSLTEEKGEIAGISYQIRGSGPPLVLLPLGLAPSQWEPLLPQLSKRYRTIVLGGAELGMVAYLESRGRSKGFLGVVRDLMDETELQPGETVLDVGCGSGVIDRWLARHTGGANRVVGVDINRYLLREATVLAGREGLGETVEFREGNAEALPFPDNTFDVVISVTVMNEVDVDQMLAEMVRVTKLGGRVAIIGRALDLPRLVNLPLRAELKTKVEAPGGLRGDVGKGGCGDASVYRRFLRAGLDQLKMFPQMATFDRSVPLYLQVLQTRILASLPSEEANEWRLAVAQAEREGTFFITQSYHCAVGTKPVQRPQQNSARA